MFCFDSSAELQPVKRRRERTGTRLQEPPAATVSGPEGVVPESGKQLRQDAVARSRHAGREPAAKSRWHQQPNRKGVTRYRMGPVKVFRRYERAPMCSVLVLQNGMCSQVLDWQQFLPEPGRGWH
jgi:hypothetical protein